MNQDIEDSSDTSPLSVCLHPTRPMEVEQPADASCQREGSATSLLIKHYALKLGIRMPLTEAFPGPTRPLITLAHSFQVPVKKLSAREAL